jgi:hypothetical protein
MLSYYISSGFNDGKLHAYEYTYINGTPILIPRDIYLELRLEDSSLTLPDSNSSYKKNIKVKIYLKVIENNEPVDKGSISLNSPKKFYDILAVSGIRIPLMTVNSDGIFSSGKTSNIDVYLEQDITDDPKTFAKGDVLGYIGINNFEKTLVLPESEEEESA